MIVDRQVTAVEEPQPTTFLAAKASELIQAFAQPSFVQPGGNRPKINRPDLVAGLSADRCLLIDIKTTSGSLSAVDYGPASFDLWAKNLTSLGFTVAGSWVLAVSSVQPATKWIEVSKRNDASHPSTTSSRV